MLERQYPYRQKVVALGGGTGLFTIFHGLVRLNQPEYNTSLPGTWDDGSSSGKLRVEMGVLPPGDLTQSILASCEDDNQFKEVQALFNDRFDDLPGLKGHSMRNLIFSRLSLIHQGGDRAIDALRSLLRIKAKIIPITLNNLQLSATTRFGLALNGESSIDHMADDKNLNPEDYIKRIHFDGVATPHPKALRSIREAEKIVFGPGSPYTSEFPHLLVDKVADTLMGSQGKLILLPNLMTTKGEDKHLDKVSQWLKVFQYYSGDTNRVRKGLKSRINTLIVNNNHMDREMLEGYKEEGQYPVELDEEECRKIAPGIDIRKSRLATYHEKSHLYRHNPIKTATVILKY